jgi:hypothetical protein
MVRPALSFVLFAASLAGLASSPATGQETPQKQAVGAGGSIGCLKDPKTVERLEIEKPGVYENYRVDGRWGTGNRVKITANDVTLRNCEIFNCGGNGVGVYATNVVIENCKIHHCLKGAFDKQEDAHGITGDWGNVVIRNCDIHHVSGDAVQFDPARRSQGKLLIENCTFWTGPLDEDRPGFKKGERPGENGVDTKVKPDGPRCELTIRNCYLHGWNQPSQITNMAALNIKENVNAVITNCVLSDNEIGFRLRGPGSRGGAHVTLTDCAVYDTKVAIRAEDKIEQLQVSGLALGDGVATPIQFVGGKPASGYENTNQREAPPLQSLLREGFAGAKGDSP